MDRVRSIFFCPRRTDDRGTQRLGPRQSRIVPHDPPLLDVAVRVLARIAPSVPLPRDSRPENLTRDPERRAAFASDRLWHRVMTPRAMLSVAGAMESVRGRPQAIHTPALFLVAGADTVVSSPDAIGYAHAITGADTTIEQIPGAYHEILNDLGRRAIFDRILRWCDDR